MAYERFRELERVWKQSGAQKDEVAYLAERLRASGSHLAFFRAECEGDPLANIVAYRNQRDEIRDKTADIAMIDVLLGRQLVTAQRRGNKRYQLLQLPGVAQAVIEQVYQGDIPEMGIEHLALTGLLAELARTFDFDMTVDTIINEEREISISMNLLRCPLSIPRVVLTPTGQDYGARQRRLAQEIESRGRNYTRFTEGMTFYAECFGTSWQTIAQSPSPSLPSDHMFYQEIEDEDRVIMGGHLPLRLRFDTRPQEPGMGPMTQPQRQFSHIIQP